MSAEILRRAAVLMRQRATDAASQSGDAWTVHAYGNGRQWLEPVHIGMHGYGMTATHIASWHPVVALAVAGWLDEVAQAWPDMDAHGLDLDEFPIKFEETTDSHALAVARAYLGEAS